jgi:hypothetical protein
MQINTDGSLEDSKCGYGHSSPRMILDIGLTPNPEETLLRREQVDKDMMIFINSWKLKTSLPEQELYGRVLNLVTSEFY